MNKIIIMVISIAAIAASQLSPAQASPLPDGLYGWTRNRDVNGNIDFVSISVTGPNAGQASFMFSMAIPSGYQARDLTYNPENRNFYGSLVPTGGGPFRFAQIDPDAVTPLTSNPYSGLQRDGVEGVEYFKDEGGVVVSGANTDGTINALYVVDHLGAVLSPIPDNTALLPGIIDQDHLGANSLGLFGGKLHVFDWNDPTNGYKINAWNAPFGGSPTLTGVYSGPVLSGDPVDLAIDPFTNTFYSSGHSRLLRYNMTLQQQEVVGNYNYSGDIWGIAATPEPTTLTLAALGMAGGLLRWRRRGPQGGVH